MSSGQRKCAQKNKMDLYRIKGYTLEGKKTKSTIASGPVIIRNQKVLLHKAPSTGKYQFVGGRLDDDLNPKTNAKYKPLVDLGLKVKIREDQDPLILLGTIQREGKQEHVVLIHYRGEIAENAKPTKGKYGWYTLKEIKELQKQNQLSSSNVMIASEYFLKHKK